MMKKNNTFILKTLIAGMLTASLNLQAVEIEQSTDGISFNALENTNYKLTLVAPNSEVFTFNINNKNAFITAGMLNMKAFADGNYKFELSPIAKPDDLASDVRALDDAKITEEFQKEFSSFEKHSGNFAIANNNLALDIEEATDKAQVFNTDLIVEGSACIGIDCTANESFGFDTLRLKENNLRIKFDDTSASASFPGNDWQLTANDSGNGGANKFAIDDITNNKTPFTVEANSPNHTLFVASEGRIGVKTNTPVVDIHVKEGNTPTLRLEQDGSDGFQSQVWDVAGNETNFFIRDVSNSSSLPFRIEPGASENRVYLDSNNNVGIGLANPAANLHVQSSDGGADELLKLSNTGGSFITMENRTTGGSWFMTHENAAPNSFNFSYELPAGGFVVPMRMTTTGNVTVLGTLTTGGTTCGGGCDLVFTEDYKLPTIEEHAAQMWENNYLPNVGPTIENEPFNLTEKTGGMLNELEKAHIYIEQLHTRLKNKENELNAMKSDFKNLEQNLLKNIELRLAKLEQK